MVTPSGVIQSTNKNYVMSPCTGEIVDMNISEGVQVEIGDVLFTVKSTDLNLQEQQIKGQKKIYEKQIAQLVKLTRSIENNTNYFDLSNEEDKLYYNQYEAYRSQVSQQDFDVNAYKAYGYTDEQIEAEVIRNQSKISEIYYTALNAIEESILQCRNEIAALEVQLNAVAGGQEEYGVKGNTTGIVHMLGDYKKGMVVQVGAAIASIASENDRYIVLANINAGDRARISVGDRVDIVVAGLVQTVYGTITGTVSMIDSDITINEKGESIFKAEIIPDTYYLVSKEGHKVIYPMGWLWKPGSNMIRLHISTMS